MLERISNYKINQTNFRICYGNITEMTADVLVSSDDNYLSMSSGVSLSLLNGGGEEIRREAHQQVPLKVGEVAVTTAGQLDARFIFHAVTLGYDQEHDLLVYPSEEIICSATEKCLQLSDKFNIHSIVFPALGTGVGRFSFQSAADSMTRTIINYLTEETQIETVVITLFARLGVNESDLNNFYERATALASEFTKIED
jgi:O-acetyl-ADP-ribose deacetylase (regulator of RNase III)